MSEKIRILVADDHNIIIDGIKAMLLKNDEIEIIGEAKDGSEAIDLTDKLQPDIIIMDISMPKISGLEATRLLKKKSENVKIIVLTQHENREYVTQLMKVGADGYLLKNSKKKELIDAIRSVYHGEKYIGKYTSGILLNTIIDKGDNSEENKRVTLTSREIEIIKMIAEDLSNQEIGQNLHISTRTVETHRRNIMLKLKVKSVVALVKYALRNNIVNLS